MSDDPRIPPELAARLANLSPAKRALFELRMKAQQGTGAAAPVAGRAGIPRLVRGRTFPLSFAQQRLWFLDQLEPGTPLYHVPSRAWLTGRLDVEALQRALDALVARHEPLRTRFPTVDGEPVQLIEPVGRCDLSVVDLSSVPADQREPEVARLVALEARRPFDLAAGPLVRAGVFRVSDDRHALLLVLHHIVCDGWSMGILFRELGTLYEAFSLGEEAALPELPIQYVDYSAWQRGRLQGPLLERELDYWKARFAAPSPTLELPFGRSRRAARTHRGASVRLAFAPALNQRLGDLTLAENVTKFMTLLAAFKVLLWRYTGQSDISVGSPIAGRTNPEIEGLVGFFVNTLALRTDLKGDPTFRELLQRVREVTVGAYEHQELPFERLVQELQPERDLSHAPLFQAMFVLQNAPKADRRLRGITIRRLEGTVGAAKFDLVMGLTEKSGTLQGKLSYRIDLFDREPIERLAEHYARLVEEVVANPGRRISEYPLLGRTELGRLVGAWSGAPAAPPGRECIHETVEQWAVRTPDAPAVVAGDECLSWSELNRRANRLAHYLHANGVGPEVRVGLFLERSPELIVALLAVLKAGGAYVPLELDYPRERLEMLVKDAGVAVLITHSQLAPRAPAAAGLDGRVVILDEHVRRWSDAANENLRSGVGAENLAYVMYTSGSTGRPKGVATPHRALVSFAEAAADAYQLTASDRVLQGSSFSSDISCDELYPAWVRGAAVVLRDAGPIPGGVEIMRLIDRQRITTISLATAVWHAWVRELHLLDLALPSSLRTMCVGGERVEPAVFQLWQELRGSSNVRWLNTYGPTETTVEVTLHEPATSNISTVEGADVPLGRPLANARVYVLDRWLEPVPIGVAGELCIGGQGVARGYLGRPGGTADRFVPDRWSGAPGARLYRTGDRGCWRADGILEFLGRVDHQVKIRGFRVELGEIEAVLGGHPSVRHCVVIAGEDGAGDRRLIAYAVPGQEAAVSASELQAYLAARLPDQMVPRAIVLLQSLPLTPTGKVDRAALPAPDAARPEAQRFIAPRTPVETTIAGVWSSLLRLEQVGVEDNFFAIGGHSLLATQVIARIRAAFGLELPLRALFEGPTVAGLAERIEAAYQLLDEIESVDAGRVGEQLS